MPETMIELSIFQNFNKVVANKELSAITDLIQSNKFKKQIEDLRVVLRTEGKKAYSDKKKSLPAFTPSGKFKGGRKASLIEHYSSFIILDIDNVAEKIFALTENLQRISYTYCAFVSPSGDGLKVLVRVDSNQEQHKTAFNQLKAYYESILKVEIDPSGKDVTRLCFFTYDPNIYVNENAKTFKVDVSKSIPQAQVKVESTIATKDVLKLIEVIAAQQTDLSSNYEDWCNIGFALEHEFGEDGRSFFHDISKFNPEYNPEICNDQYSKCLKSGSSGISIKTLFHIAKKYGITIPGSATKSKNTTITTEPPVDNVTTDEPVEEQKKNTTNKFIITEEYLKERYIIRYNVVACKFEYKEKDAEKFKELNENNLFIKLQKDNINISLNHLIALLKSDFVTEYNPFTDYFENLPEWDGNTDYIQNLCNFLQTPDKDRLERHFKKWLVRLVRTATDDHYHNKQALVLVSNKQNSGKSTFCRFLCPYELKDYIVENIGTDKDSLVAITENLLINLDELSTADKNEINTFKSMFSKDKIKARLTYDKRASVHVRRASFVGSTDRWEFLTDENGSVRWLCFDISFIDWKYSKEVNIDQVFSQAYHLLKKTSFDHDLTAAEIKENDEVNKKYQVSTPERDLIQRYLRPSDPEKGEFLSATDIIDYISNHTKLKLSPANIGKEMKFLGYDRISKRFFGLPRYGYYAEKVIQEQNKQ